MIEQKILGFSFLYQLVCSLLLKNMNERLRLSIYVSSIYKQKFFFFSVDDIMDSIVGVFGKAMEVPAKTWTSKFLPFEETNIG